MVLVRQLAQRQDGLLAHAPGEQGPVQLLNGLDRLLDLEGRQVLSALEGRQLPLEDLFLAVEPPKQLSLDEDLLMHLLLVLFLGLIDLLLGAFQVVEVLEFGLVLVEGSQEGLDIALAEDLSLLKGLEKAIKWVRVAHFELISV